MPIWILPACLLMKTTIAAAGPARRTTGKVCLPIDTHGYATTMPLHIQTPLLISTPISAAFGHQVLLKMDALQPSGSFKMRGIGHACEVYAARGAKRFVSSSGGNAGIAVAVAGRQLGIPVTVVVPETTGARARDILKSE